MTRIDLVRHGPTHAKSMVGWSDIPADLSDAAALSRLSAYLPADATVISSDLIRAIETANAIQGIRPRLPHHPGLREINFGAWELQRFKDVEATDPDRIRAYWQTPGDISPPGGESWNQVRTRVDTTIDTLISDQSGQNLIVVAHFGMILTQLQRALGLTASGVFAHKIDNLSVTTIISQPTGWHVGAINHQP